MNDMELLYAVANLAQFDACDAIWWRINADRSSEATGLNVFAQCGDFFDWGSADLEQITPENLPLLRQAVADIKELTGSEYDNQSDAFLLFCARSRKRRPQGAYYKYLTVHASVPDGLNEYGFPKRREDKDASEAKTAALRALFDAAGDERPIDLCNPKDQDGNYKYTPEVAAGELQEGREQ